MRDALIDSLTAALGTDAVSGDLAERLQWAGDASIYELVPRALVFPRDAGQVAVAMRLAVAAGAPVCFRAGGTSLSGQAVTDGVLIIVSRHLRGIAVLDEGGRVRCEPGAIGAWVNAALARHGRRIGPDPASMQAAEIGGIVANNASGMCCGIADNSYQTVTGLDLVLADGWRIDTAAPDADQRMRDERPDLAHGLLALRDELRADADLAARVRRGFATKNTVGYSLNALLDEQHPARILQRLVVGSEGTLAFIAAATFRTLPLPRHRATAWLLFRDLEAAGEAVAPLAAAGAAAVELLDAVALRRVEAKLPEPLPTGEAGGEAAALLVEYQEAEAAALDQRLARIAPALAGFALLAPAAFTRDPLLQARYWAIRKGLFPSVGAVRAAGTAVVIEDITFPVAGLAAGVRALRGCFRAHGYDDAVIFGHAKDGNLHFTLTPDLAQAAERARYDRFMRALVDLVLAHGGNLKAEHGTGRNMAPFVVRQWGEPAVALMRRIKALLDPRGVLNPGVLLSDDPEAHLRHLKILPPVDAHVDRCIECGFCEPACPSRDVTMSPRQRITALRWLAKGDAAQRAAVAAAWRHRGLDTCAGDGLCAAACPVHIDTGDLVRAARARGRGALARWVAGRVAGHLGAVGTLARWSLAAGGLLPRRTLPGRRVPLPPAAPALPRRWPGAEAGAATVVYVPTCLARTFGPDPLPAILGRLCAAAGIGLVVPEGSTGLCCGQPFASKGFPDAARAVGARLARAVLAAAGEPALAVVTDTSTCAAQFGHLGDGLAPAERLAWERLVRHHPAGFAARVLVPRLVARGRLRPSQATLALHPTCSEQKEGWSADLAAAVAGASTAPPVLPMSLGCCGMAGDKGWDQPALTAGATRREAAEAVASGAQGGACTSATCGLALGAASGLVYRHVWALLDQALVPAPGPPEPATAG